MVSDAINLSGIARAQGVGVNGQGEISLLASAGVVTVSGTADATSSAAGALGGDVTMIGGTVHLTGTARVNASGVGGGGTVVLGGNLAGLGTNATALTTVDQGALVYACGTLACASDGTGGAGNGGTIRLYSTLCTTLGGELNTSSDALSRAGAIEVISNSGVTSMTSMARIIDITGVDQLAGLAVIVGDSLSLAPTSFVNMSDYASNLPAYDSRLLSNPDAAAGSRFYLFDPGVPLRQSSHPILFHAYDGDLTYPDHLPTLLAEGFDGPVGAVRPNGGAPTTFAATGADTLAAIPVSFAAPIPTGTDNLTTQVANTTNSLARDTDETTASIVKAGQSEVTGAAPMSLVSGGPGVAQIADLGKSGAVAGASPDVFGANFHVLAPAGNADDTQVGDYLCLTPFDKNACGK